MKPTPLRITAFLVLLVSALLAGACQSTPAQVTIPPDPAGTIAASAADQPPAPAGRQKRPDYPFEMRRADISGMAMVRIVVTTEGKVINAVAVKATHPSFAVAAVAAVSQWRYQPALKNGQPVNAHLEVPVHFNLNIIR
jgi:TonB family protein